MNYTYGFLDDLAAQQQYQYRARYAPSEPSSGRRERFVLALLARGVDADACVADAERIEQALRAIENAERAASTAAMAEAFAEQHRISNEQAKASAESHRQRMAAWTALPWYVRIFRSKP